MKKIIVIGLFLVCGFVNAADKEILPIDENGRVVYTEVVTAEGVLKNELYSRAMEWFARTFHSAQNVIQMQDKEEGKIVGKGNIQGIDVTIMMTKVKGLINLTISVFVKDGRYKYQITDLYHEGQGYTMGEVANGNFNGGPLESDKPACSRSCITMKKWRSIKEQAHEKISLMVTDLKTAMEGKGEKKDW